MSKQPEQIRLALDIIRSTLAPLTEAERTTVFVELAIVEATELDATRKLLDEARETAEEWKRHNDQRQEEVWTARELLKATPNETLPMAVKRWTDHPCALGMHQYPPGTTVCTCGRVPL